jgi:chromosome segregation ATPase
LNIQSAKQREGRSLEAELRELRIQEKDLVDRGRKARGEIQAAEQELAALDSQEGQQLSKVENLSRDTAAAWKWIQENQGNFEQEVYGPPLISCSIKDPRYTSAIESLVNKTDILTITAQTNNDMKKLSDHLYGTMKLADVSIRVSKDPIAAYGSPPLSNSQLERFGLDDWAVNYIDGPEPVLSMLCGSKAIHKSAVSLRDISEEQHNALLQTQCRVWVVGSHCYRTNVRAEYGSQATSTTTRSVAAARFWTDRPIDSSAKREIQGRIDTLNQEFSELKERIKPLRIKIDALEKAVQNIKEEVVSQTSLTSHTSNSWIIFLGRHKERESTPPAPSWTAITDTKNTG